MYRIQHRTFRELDMTATAYRPDGTTCVLRATWAWAPELSWYDTEKQQWLSNNEWEFTFN